MIEEGDRIYRAVDRQFAQLYEELLSDALGAELMKKQFMVATWPVADPALDTRLKTEYGSSWSFLEHERVSTISYPYEWTISMLADAAVTTLDLQLCLLKRSLSLKDASAFNVQFRCHRPVFIDITSIERAPRLDTWFALGQFNRMFTFPLLLARHRNWDLGSYFLGHPDGRSERQTVDDWGSFARWHPRLVFDVTLPALLSGRSSPSPSRAMKPPCGGPLSQVWNLQRVRRKVHSLASSYRPRSPWSNYDRRGSYSIEAERSRRDIVARFLADVRPKRVVDIGCNDGEFSYLAAEHGSEVIAIDADHDTVERLYRGVRGSNHSILPLVADITNPSPGTGFGGAERRPLLDRLTGDCVFALAVLHHLLVTGVRHEDIAEVLSKVTTDHLVAEYIPPNDPQFRRLMDSRRPLSADLSLDGYVRGFERSFKLTRHITINDSARSLLFLRKS